jgi:Zn-dependent protease
VCDHCHTLVHSEELERLAASAKAAETAGELQRARELWLTALRLLPPSSKQADWIRQHAATLEERAGARPAAGSADMAWTRPAQPDLTTLTAAKPKVSRRVRLQLTSFLSFIAFIAIYAATSGIRFGVGFAVLILIHEMGHFIDIKRRGLPADMPVFLPGLGAYVRWEALGVPLETRAAVSLAGPLAGFLAALACALLWWQTGDPLWAALARSGAILNLLNLIPVWVLDGGQAALALNKAERIALLAAGIVLWLALGQRLFLLVSLGAGYRAFFAADLPAASSRATIIYFVAVLTALGVIIRLMPGTGLGLN